MQDIENLGDNVDYSMRFVIDRMKYMLGRMRVFGITLQFTRASYKQKEGRSKVSLYLRYHRYGRLRDELHNLDNFHRPGSTSRTCGCKFMIVESSRNLGQRPWTVRVNPGEKVTRLLVDIRQYIKELSATSIQPAFIMTPIRQNVPSIFASMNQIYNLR